MKIQKLFASIAVSSLLMGAGSSVFACEIDVDIHPTSCPNPINVGSNGLVPAAILGTGDMDVRNIDLSRGVELWAIVFGRQVIVNGIKAKIEDVATPYDGNMDCSNEYSCNEYTEDGYKDLTVKFPAQGSNGNAGVADLLAGMENGNTRCLEIQAWDNDGKRWHGKDVVIVKGVKKPKVIKKPPSLTAPL